MLNGCDKSRLKTLGLVCNVCLFVIIFVCMFLVGYDYRQAHQNWIGHGGYRHLGIVQVTTVVVAFVVIILGFAAFTVSSNNKPVVGIVSSISIYIAYKFVGLNTLSMLFTLSISIFALVGGTVGNFGDYLGCNTKYKRILTYWRSLDYLMIEVDKVLCGNDCHCDVNIYAQRMFESDPYASLIFSDYSVNLIPTALNVINFQNCKRLSKERVNTSFIENEKNTWGELAITDFDIEKFATFWGYIENRFECAGWCTTAYQTENYNKLATGQRMMYKYLFSDINKGPVKNKGCLKQILNWFPRAMLAYGSLTFFAGIFQIIAFIMALALLLHKSENEDNESKPKQTNNQPEDQKELNSPAE